MDWLIVENGIILNIIVADPDIAAKLGAVPSYDGCQIGETYNPPHETTDLESAQQEITDKDLALIEQGQSITDLELSILSKE